MSVNAGLGKIKQADKDLRRRWREVCVHWDDENRRVFEQRLIVPMQTRLRNVELAMGHMATVLQKMRRDCE